MKCSCFPWLILGQVLKYQALYSSDERNEKDKKENSHSTLHLSRVGCTASSHLCIPGEGAGDQALDPSTAGCTAAKGPAGGPAQLLHCGSSCSNCAAHCWLFFLVVYPRKCMGHNQETETLQSAFTSSESVSSSIRGRSWSSFNRQFSDSSEHSRRKKSPKIMIHFLKCCLSLSPLKMKMSLVIQVSFHAVTNAGTRVQHTQAGDSTSPHAWVAPQSTSPCSPAGETLPGLPTVLGKPPINQTHGLCLPLAGASKAYQIANGAEIKHSF